MVETKGFYSQPNGTPKFIAHCASTLKSLAIPAGFEPATHGVEIRYSIQLSYGTVGPSYHEKHEKAATRTGQKCGNGPTLGQAQRTPVRCRPFPSRRPHWAGITLQLVRPDIRQSCILLPAVSSRASHSPNNSNTTAMASPAIAVRRFPPCSGSVILRVRP
jgi:hypothetical protein